MKKFSIRSQILLIAMIPVFLIDVILTTVHINSSITQARELLQSKGEIIAKQIASASEFYLFSGNFNQVQHLLDLSIDRNDIIYSVVYDQQGTLIASARGSGYNSLDSSEYIHHRQAVQTQDLNTEDVFEPEQESVPGQMRTLGWVHLYLSPQKLKRQVAEIFTEGLVFFLAMLVVASALTAIISHRITRPVYVLLDHLKKVEKGDLGQLIKDIKNNEIGDVQKGFNSMTQSLLVNRTHLNQKIDTATHELRHVVIDLEDKNQQLGVARDAAQEANRVKSQFLANISHEIRTPINGIKGFVNLLSGTALNTTQKRYAEIIHQSTVDLSAIINEVLDFSKMESGKIDIVDEEFDLFNLVESARDSLFTASMDKGIDLYLTIYSDTPQRMVGDAYRLKQILINLVGNAIKFTDNGHVNIVVMLQDQNEFEYEIIFRIEDSGIGISAQDQQRLFQAFSQIESDSNRRFAGTGLGLVISKNLAHLMGGDIEMQSDLGEGSTFTLTLPFRPPAEQSEEINPLDGKTALVYTFTRHGEKELQALFDRVGLDTETQFLEPTTELSRIRKQLLQNMNHIDFIVFDLRRGDIVPRDLLDASTGENIRVIVMHYDISLVDSTVLAEFEFLPVINTCRNIRRQLSRPVESFHREMETGASEVSGTSKILIVDDNPVNLALATELTRLWGHQPFQAGHAREAMSLFQQQEFDLILLDIQMPEIDGVELMKMMRKTRPQLRAPIVAITANIQESERHRLLNLGFDFYLGKPLEELQLKALIDRQPVPDSSASLPPVPAQSDPAVSIDLPKSLLLSGNRQHLQNEMLTQLQQSIPDLRKELTEALNAQSADSLDAVIHKLHGVTCYTHLPRLSQILAAYESAKDGNEPEYLGIIDDIISELAQIHRLIDDELKFG